MPFPSLSPMFLVQFLLRCSVLAAVYAYIPASPTNSSQDAIAGGLNVTDISNLFMQWYSNGSYAEHVSYQLVGNGSQGISKGALVHFSEDNVNASTPPSLTPWIAMVSCDHNATTASMEEDVFTLARDKGAVAALLYSLYSLACVINPEYADPGTFDQVFDIFSTQSLTSAHLIEYQFGQLAPQNTSLYEYNSQQLNSSATVIQKSVAVGYPVSAGFLYAVLQAYNATGSVTSPGNNGGNVGASNNSNSSSPNTALAMIILYAITGCVSALFCLVIISGAIRAIRHPERYGPRARIAGEGGQSRARGLTRAILDTFPIVKFGSNPGGNTSNDIPTTHYNKDAEAQYPTDDQGQGIEMNGWEGERDAASHSTMSTRQLSGPAASSESLQAGLVTEPSGSKAGGPSTIPSAPTGSTSTGQHNSEGSSKPVVRDDVVPDSIGRETCPICIVDFEEGDDIRLLPCEGKHCFHQQCVDPWLLELSSSCPICRQDFLALENMISGRSEDAHNTMEVPRGGVQSAPGNRFSRYLRFARGRRNRGDEPDPTDPYMPTAPESSMY